MLIKAVTTLDVLSRGRAWLGIGAGYGDSEARAMGLETPTVGERFDGLADPIDIAARMWAGDESPFRGRRHVLEHPIGRPGPISEPRPRLLIGGTGERRTLRLVAEYAHAGNLFDFPMAGPRCIARSAGRASTTSSSSPAVVRGPTRASRCGRDSTAGLVARAQDPANRRPYEITLTPAGDDLSYNCVTLPWPSIAACAMDNEKSITELRRLLAKLGENVATVESEEDSAAIQRGKS